jgi:hypothetical protein
MPIYQGFMTYSDRKKSQFHKLAHELDGRLFLILGCPKSRYFLMPTMSTNFSWMILQTSKDLAESIE